MGNIVMTGANRGIGLEIAKILVEKGHRLIALCREASSELKELDNVQIIEGLDVSQLQLSSDIVQKVKSALESDQIDALFNVAGLMHRDSLDDPKSLLENLEKQWRVNTYGPLNMTCAFLPLMSKGSKIIMISSRMGSIADNTSGGFYGYRSSKAALNMISESLALDLKDRGVSVSIIHPGFVKTRMTDFNGNITPEESAKSIVKRFEELNLENSGTFLHAPEGEKLPW